MAAINGATIVGQMNLQNWTECSHGSRLCTQSHCYVTHSIMRELRDAGVFIQILGLKQKSPQNVKQNKIDIISRITLSRYNSILELNHFTGLIIPAIHNIVLLMYTLLLYQLPFRFINKTIPRIVNHSNGTTRSPRQPIQTVSKFTKQRRQNKFIWSLIWLIITIIKSAARNGI